MKKQILSLLLCLTMLFGMMPFTALATTEISAISLKGLSYPEAGKTASSFNAFTTSTDGISFYGVEWYDRTDRRFLEQTDTFIAGHQYYVEIWVEADDGYTFKCVNDSTPGVTATIDGQEMEVTKAYEYKAFAMVVLTYYFPAVPQKGWIETAKVTVPAPVAGQKPSYTQLSTDQFSSKNVYFSGDTDEKMKNGIAWYSGDYEELSPDTDVFAEQTAYTFHTLLFPESGYSFNDNTKVYVNGKLAKAVWDYATFMSVSYQFPATGSGHTHTPSEWRTTQVYHYKVCTTCGEMLQEEDHTGGIATCAEKGVCTVCGYAYIETNENHVPDTGKWVPRAEMYHFHKCTLCGAHCDIEDHKWSPKYHAVGASGHAYQCADCKGYDTVKPHVPGPTGTPGAAQLCKDCGYVIKPAADHTHTLTPVTEVAPTCMDAGVRAHYICSGCNQTFGTADGTDPIADNESLITPPLGHQISDEWKCNGDTHWRICKVCNTKMIETDMKHELKDGKCTTCGFDSTASKETAPTETAPVSAETAPVSTENTTEATQSNPAPNDPQPQKTAKSGLPWWALVLIGLGAVGAGIGVGVLTLHVTKKKTKE